jgi:hypothetical protein
MVSSSFAQRHQAWVEVTNNDTHTSLLQNGVNYGIKGRLHLWSRIQLGVKFLIVTNALAYSTMVSIMEEKVGSTFGQTLGQGRDA